MRKPILKSRTRIKAIFLITISAGAICLAYMPAQAGNAFAVCRHDECTRKWITHIVHVSGELYNIYLTSADFDFPAEGQEPSYTNVRNESDYVRCGSIGPYTQSAGGLPIMLGDHSDVPSEWDTEFITRERLWGAVCKGEFLDDANF